MDLFGSGEKLQHRTYVKEGEKCEASGDLKGAIDRYTKAIETQILKDNPEYMLHYKRARVYEKMNEVDKAADDYKIFLSADDRTLKGSSPWETVDSLEIGMQRGNAKTFTTGLAYERLLNTCDLNPEYFNTKLYDFGPKSVDAKKMKKENPQESAYRMGIIPLLQGQNEEAIKHLDEAIKINPEDARSYLFRGIAHTLQSRKGGFWGRGDKANALSKINAMSDFDRVVALSQDTRLIEQASNWKKQI